MLPRRALQKPLSIENVINIVLQKEKKNITILFTFKQR